MSGILQLFMAQGPAGTSGPGPGGSFGYDGPTAGLGQFPLSDDRALVTKYVLGSSVTVSSMDIFLIGVASAGGAIRGLIFADNAGAPGALVAASAAKTFVGGETDYMNIPITQALSPGTYWLGVVTGGQYAVYAGHQTGQSPDNLYMANGTYSFSSPNATWPGTDATYGSRMAIRANY